MQSIIVLIALATPTCRCPSVPIGLWNVGMMLDVSVECHINGSFVVYIFASGMESANGRDCLQLTLLPGDKAPKHLQTRHRILVNAKSGRTEGAYTFPDRKSIPLLRAEGLGFASSAPPGVPLELFGSLEVPEFNVQEIDAHRFVTLRKQASGEFVHIEMTAFVKDIEELKVRQTWVPGEKWWREYERYVKGKKDLTAKLLNPPPLKADLEAQKKLVEDWKKFTELVPLGKDGRLHTRLTIVERDPELHDVLNRLGAATKLTFVLADNLADHDPDLGAMSLKNVHAFSFMELIAMRDLQNGRWTQIDGGYRLEGVSKRLRPPPPPKPFPWGWVAMAITAIVAGGVAIVLYGRRHLGNAAETGQRPSRRILLPK
jgi:hypothetical protein